MATNQELRQRVADIDATIASGARTVTVDGVTVSIDLEALRKERQRIEKQLPETRRKRPRVYGFRFNG